MATAPFFLKQLAWDARVAAFDWAATGLGLAVFLGTVAYGLRAGNVPVTVFGSIGALTAARQLLGYHRAGRWTKSQWLLNHISGFMASYIAAVSAFSVTSPRFIPFPYNFLWPALVGAPIIAWWQVRVRRGGPSHTPAQPLAAAAPR